jgi:alanine-synthesizing transaminase
MFSSRGPANRDPNSFARALQAARKSERALLDLTVSNPTNVGFHYDSATILDALGDPGVLTYTPDPRGALAAREAIVGLWADRGISTQPDRVLLTASTSEAYALLFKLLCDPGDEVLAPQPSYPLFDLLARLEAVRLVSYPLRYDGAWHVDVAALRAAVTPRTRAVLVVSPNNPTGSYLSRAEHEALRELELPILCDEVSADYPLGDDRSRARSVLEQPDGLAFALDGLSKAVGLPQLKLGWITAGGSEPLVVEAMARLEIIADTYLSVGSAVQLAAPRLLSIRPRIQHAIGQRLRANLATLRAACEDSAVTVLDVRGGWYAILRLPAVVSEQRWALDLLEQGVVVQPGWLYDFIDGPHLVVSLLTPEPELDEGAHKIVERVARLCE